MPTLRPPSSSERDSFDLLPLFEFSNVVNSSLDLTFILNTVLRTLMGKMLVSKGMVFLQKEERQFEVIAAKGVAAGAIGTRLLLERMLRSLTQVRAIKTNNAAWGTFLRSHEQEILIPILSGDHIVGFISLGGRLSKSPYSKIDRNLIQSLVNLSGAAIEKGLILDKVRDANRHLDRKYQELNTLFDLSKEFNIGMDQEKVIRLITFALLGQVGVKNYAICLRDDRGMNIIASRLEAGALETSTLHPLCELRKAELIEDLLRLKQFRGAAADLHSHGILAIIPMHVQQQTRGALLLGRRIRGDAYTKGDLEFLYSLGNLAIISIENARLFKEAIEKQRMDDELQIAREIQQGLLPETLPTVSGFDIAAVNISSKQVGGDYYDVLKRDENEFVIAIGDVSGKGTPAALLMANVQAALRALSPIKRPLGETTAQINDLTCANTRSGTKFITFFWGVLNTTTRTFRYVNAGHNPPILLRKDGTVERLEEGGLILGIMRNAAPYPEGEVRIGKGDVLVLYTDGVSEAMDAEGNDFTEERFEAVLKGLKPRSAREIVDGVLAEVEKHAGGTPQSDDITLVVLKA